MLFRRGYHSYTTLPGFDRREYITRHRVEAAAAFAKEVKDLRVRLSASLSTRDGRTTVDVTAVIDPSRLYFRIRNGVRYGQIDVAVIPMDQERAALGETYKKQVAHLEYDESTFALVKRLGIPYRARLSVPPGTRYVRVVVYDYMLDLVGTAGAWVG